MGRMTFIEVITIIAILVVLTLMYLNGNKYVPFYF